jgi:CcmD family protein
MNLIYLFIAYAVIWTALFLFILNISNKLKQTLKEIELLQRHLDARA